MDFFTIIPIAVALAMDAFAVSIVSGAAYKQLHVKHALRMALFFGAFQAFMPLIGALAGLSLKQYVGLWGHWIAFGLLTGVGLKMIYESFKIKQAEKRLDPSNIVVVLVLSVATSIDALAAGVTLSLLVKSVALAVTVIGVVTFGLSYSGVYVGKRFGHFFETKLEALGGLVLIALAAKILLQHLLS
ncbi:MAG: manganese efflux pump MntP [Planctomycetota bacterium]|jgi:putative Mn2+ efflux pump MntP